MADSYKNIPVPTPTQNPVPSADIRDHVFGGAKIDEFVTSENHVYVDRFGDEHRTIAGINYDANQAMLNYCYITKKSFEIGATLDTPNTVLQWESNGEYYRWDGDWSQPKVVPAGSTPDSTGGIGEGKWVGVGDASLRHDLSTTTGSELVNTPAGTVEERLTTLSEKDKDIESNLVTNIIPCSTPTVGMGVKAIVKISSDDDFYIISKKANGKSGFIASRVTNEASPSDAGNYGGQSPFRPGSVDNIRDAVVAKLAPYAKGTGVILSSFNPSQIATLFGFSATGASINANTAAGDYTLYSPQVYQVPNGTDITYQLSVQKAKIRFAGSNNSSATINISISRDGTNWLQTKTLTTQLPPAGQSPLPMEVDVDGLPGTWYLKIANAHTAPCYVVGLNILSIGGDVVLDYDNIMATLLPDFASGPAYYFGGSGATEFAAKEKSTGKLFGTFHGGHGDFLQRLRTENSSYNLDSGSAPVLLLTHSAVLHSSSVLTIGSSSYRYVASTIFGDGTHTTRFSLKLNAGTPIICERIYTHMATSCRNFDWIHLPLLVNKTDDGDVALGQTGFIHQFRSDDTATINCSFSQVNIQDNSLGAYVSFQPNYNKQYYGTAFSSGGHPLSDGMYTTCKEFF
ncbi:head-binding protein [Citrobacter portucalensis]|uniref:tail fiber/spike domain-containing protein n=1 Tax=Citrobacter portucalensis TaxID=1639133 RepID=UPI0039FBF7C1|nr:head-binding protein [Citrobacter freundii]